VASPAQEHTIGIEFTIGKAVQHACEPPLGVTP
jgi:hypothetical protein